MSAKKTTKPARAPVQGREARILEACVRVLGDTPKARAFAAALFPFHAEPKPPSERDQDDVLRQLSIDAAPGEVESAAQIAAARSLRAARDRRRIVDAARKLQSAINDCGAHYLGEVGQTAEVQEVWLVDPQTGEDVPIGQRFVPSEFMSMLSAMIGALDERKKRRGRPPVTGKGARKLRYFMHEWNRIVQAPIEPDPRSPFREALRRVGPAATGLDYGRLKKAFERMVKDEWAIPVHWRTGEARKRPGLPAMTTFADDKAGQK